MFVYQKCMIGQKHWIQNKNSKTEKKISLFFELQNHFYAQIILFQEKNKKNAVVFFEKKLASRKIIEDVCNIQTKLS